MRTLREKITLTLSGLLYLVMNLVTGESAAAIVRGTAWQLLTMLPWTAGLTGVVVIFLKQLSGGEKVPWDRVLRIFFAIGIIASLLMAISQYAQMGAVAVPKAE